MMAAKIIGINALAKWSDKARRNIANNERMFAQGVTVVDGWIQRNFKAEGGLIGGWQPLSQATIERRRHGKKKGAGTRILQDTGQLRARWRRTWTSKRGVIESGVPYAVFHNKGTKNIPQRRILPEASEIQAPLAKVFGDAVEKVLRS